MGGSNLPLWLVEDCTWIVLWLSLIAGVAAFAYYLTAKKILVFVLAALIAGIAAVIAFEQATVTDREHLVDVVHQMARLVRANDSDGIAQFIHPENEKLRSKLKNDVRNYHVTSCNLIAFNRKDVAGGDAKIGFVVFGSAMVNSNGPYTANVVVQLDFEKSNDQWFLSGYRYRPSNSQTWLGERN